MVSNFNGREQKTVTERNTIRKKSETVSLEKFQRDKLTFELNRICPIQGHKLLVVLRDEPLSPVTINAGGLEGEEALSRMHC